MRRRLVLYGMMGVLTLGCAAERPKTPPPDPYYMLMLEEEEARTGRPAYPLYDTPQGPPTFLNRPHPLYAPTTTCQQYNYGVNTLTCQTK